MKFLGLIILSPYGSRHGRKFLSVIPIPCHHIHNFRIRTVKFNHDDIPSHLLTFLQEQGNGVGIWKEGTVIWNILSPYKIVQAGFFQYVDAQVPDFDKTFLQEGFR